MTEFSVTSSDDVPVALHHLAEGPAATPLLIAHATGFNAPAYAPMAEALADRFDVWGLDLRGHGETPMPDQAVEWQRFGDDAAAAATWLLEHNGAESLVGFGHSMGGAALLIAATRRSQLFRLLVLFEPISFEPGNSSARPNPLADGALRRRREFVGYRAAFDNFASKPPMNSFDPAALRGYVWGGLSPVAPDAPDGPVRLRCSPEHESATFRTADGGLWADLPSIDVSTLVIGGTTATGEGPALFAPTIAQRLPSGRFEHRPEFDHFGPFVHPAKIADVVRAAASA